MKRWTKRRYFKLVWYPTLPDGKKINLHGIEMTVVTLTGPLAIFGYEDDSEYAEDHALIDKALLDGRVYGEWFSTQCVEGEWGSHLIANARQILAEEFEEAKNNGFRVDWTREPRKEGL